MAAVSDIIMRHDLSPLPGEGGYFRFIDTFGENSGCIYYLITRDTFSSLHRLTDDEMWFFLEGGEAEQLIIHPDGREDVRRLSASCRSSLVKAECWQGTKLRSGEYALFSTVMSPRYRDDMYSSPSADVIDAHPAAKEFLP